ncbi:hypothetical protein T484DRAFT_1832541, partial [Baffinella frigidus]
MGSRGGSRGTSGGSSAAPSEAGSRTLSRAGSFSRGEGSDAGDQDKSKKFLVPLGESTRPPQLSRRGSISKSGGGEAQLSRRGSISSDRSGALSGGGGQLSARRGSVSSNRSGGDGQLSQRGSQQGSQRGGSSQYDRAESGRTGTSLTGSQNSNSGDQTSDAMSERLLSERKARMKAGIREDLGASEFAMSHVVKREYLVDEFDMHSEAVYDLIKEDGHKTFGFDKD